MKQAIFELSIQTRGRGFLDITSQVQGQLENAGIGTGLATLLIQHTSASLLIQENADPDVRADFERFFSELVPDGHALFEHVAEGEDDMSAHIRCALTTSQLSVPIRNGALWLGTWQAIYLWEHRTSPHARKVALHLIGE